MKFAVVSVFLGLAATMQLVAAQSLSACAEACVGQAAQADGCGSITNVTCVCTNAQFQQDALSCLTSECSPSDLNALVTLQTQVCNAAGLSATGSATNTATFSASDISSGTGTSLSIPASIGASSSGSGSASASTSASGSTNSGSASTSAGTTPTATGPVSSASSVLSSLTSVLGGTSTSSSAAGATSSSAAQNLQVPSFGLGLMALFALL